MTKPPVKSVDDIPAVCLEDDLVAIRKYVTHFNRIEMAVMDRLLNWVQEGQINAMCLTAEERYQKLLQEQPLMTKGLLQHFLLILEG